MTVLVWNFCLIFARVATFVAVVPLFGSSSVPKFVKAGLAFSLTMIWFVPLAEEFSPVLALTGSVPATVLGHMAALVRQMLLGGILGYGLGLFMVPAQIAGEYLTQEMGLSFGAQVNPTGDGSSSPLTQILELLAIAIFFSVDGHHVLLGALHSTFLQYPIAGAMPEVPVARAIAGASMAEEWGLMLAAPIALVLFLTTVLLALLTRTAPQMNLYAVGFPLRLVVGLAATFLLLPTWISSIVTVFSHFGELVNQLI